MTQQLLLQWPTVTIGPSGETLSDLTFEGLMGVPPQVSMTDPQELLSTRRVSLRSLTDSELMRFKMPGMPSLLDTLPRPSRCSDEQLAMALGYLYSLTDNELELRYRYCKRMVNFLMQSGKTDIGVKLRNLAIYGDLLSQAMAARATDKSRRRCAA